MFSIKQCRVYLVLVLLGPLMALNAQSIEEVQKIFPGEYAVILNHNRDIRIFLKDNQPVAESKETVDILVLNDKANGIYNKYKIFHSSFNEVKDLDAYTKVPDGNKFRKIKVTDIKTQSSRSSGVFYDDTKETAFDFPSLSAGAVGCVTYTEFYKDAHFLSPFYFSSYMPVVNAKFTVTCPADMQLKYLLKNNDNGRIKVQEEKKGRSIIYTFSSSNQSFKDSYSNAPSRSYYEPHAIVHIGSFVDNSGKQVSFLNSVDDLYKWNYGFIEKVNTKPSDVLQSLADSLTAGVTSDREKAKKIYKWVQDHIKYVAFEDGLEGFIPRQAADVCTKRYGDCKDMASLLTALLKLAGLKAYFTWIGTREISYLYTEVPLPITDNHMISAVNIDKDWIFLDGTDPNGIFGEPSQGIQGKQALIGLSDKEYKLFMVPVPQADKNFVIDSTFISVTDRGIKGSSSVYFNGYFGVDAFNTLLYMDNKQVKDYIKARLSKGSNKFSLQDYSVNKVNISEKIMNVKTNFEVPDYGKLISDEYYINLNLDRYFNTSVIDTAKRMVAVENNFKFHVKNFTVLEVPEGYAVGYLPDNFKIKNELFSFDINYKQEGNKVIATQQFKSDCMLLQPKDFYKWNETIREVTNQYKKQLMLKKK